MGKLLYFDFCAILVIGVLLVSTFLRKMTHGRQNRYYMIVLGISFISVAADILAVQLDQAGNMYVAGKYIAHTVYLFFHNAMTPFYILYLAAITDAWYRFEKNRLVQVLFSVPIIIVAALLAVNFFTPVMFYFDSTGDYVRGPYFLLLYASAVFYVAVGLYHLIRYHRLFSLQQFISVTIMFPLLLCAVVVQLFLPNFLVEMFACALSFLCVSMLVQRPEEIMDADSGLLNRKAYSSDMRKAMINKKPLRIVMIDISNFQAVCDVLGFELTEQLVRKTAERLLELHRNMKIRPEAYHISRGMIVVSFSPKYFHKVDEYVQTIDRAMKPNHPVNGMDIHLQAKIYILRWPEDAGTIDQLIAFEQEIAELQDTGEPVYVSSLHDDRNIDIRRNIDRLIERGLAEHNFEVYYQPIYSLAEGRFRSAEALLRLKDPEYGFIPPDIFITAAEKSGAIHKIGEFVLEEVCKFIASPEYQKLGLEYIEINLSVVQCMRANLAEEILSMLERYHVNVDQINLEITETAAAVKQNMLAKNLEALNAAGVQFSLDDFGTGYSNMQRVAMLPLKLVKLDKSFVDGVDNERIQIVIQDTVRMIKDMQMKIVVEGIENANMVQFFSRLNCEYIQGYYYSRPIPRQQFIDFLLEKGKGLEKADEVEYNLENA